MRLGVDADNWEGQIDNPRFEASLRQMKLDFISWHVSPQEESNPSRLDAIVQFCRRNHWSYLFNTELANYVRDYPGFRHSDGTYRYDLAEQTLEQLKNDPLFLGVVYDEVDLVQAMCGMADQKGKIYEPILADTRKMTAAQAFLAISHKVAELQHRYQAYGKRLIFEMTFPDYPFAFARGGALLAPKLLKENFNDLMYAVYRGAALEYHSTELWACIDLWFLDKFPLHGTHDQSYHTPEQLLSSLQFAYTSGFDYIYLERVGALMSNDYKLNEYGEQLLQFNGWREAHQQGNWRTAAVKYVVRRFPDGYWGQDYSPSIPDHPYGTWAVNPYRALDKDWLSILNKLSGGVIPTDADTWDASLSSSFKSRPYQSLAGLQGLVVFDQCGKLPSNIAAPVFNLCPR
jgi:hypothetical protein